MIELKPFELTWRDQANSIFRTNIKNSLMKQMERVIGHPKSDVIMDVIIQTVSKNLQEFSTEWAGYDYVFDITDEELKNFVRPASSPETGAFILKK